jgi:hypothetical protein
MSDMEPKLREIFIYVLSLNIKLIGGLMIKMDDQHPGILKEGQFIQTMADLKACEGLIEDLKSGKISEVDERFIMMIKIVDIFRKLVTGKDDISKDEIDYWDEALKESTDAEKRRSESN